MFKHPLLRFFSSLKLAVVLILSLAFVLAIGTGLESVYGTRAVKAFVYGTPWFAGLLFLLAVSLTTAALSRYPWKRHQTGFVCTHIGIIVLIIGAFFTSHYGVDGNLPVREGTYGTEVILNELVLTIENNERREMEIMIPEAPREKTGNLQEIKFDGATLTMDRFLPRVSVEREVQESPVAGVGAPAIQVTLANSRFKVTEWLVQKDASVPAEINLGPAVMSFEAARDEGSFLKGGGKRAPEKDPGTIVLTRNGKSHRARIVDALKGWMKMGDGLTLKAEKYFAYASVEKNQLVSKSDEPLNPAVTLLVRDASGNEEKHTIFALYPEFATMHKSHQSSATQVLGVSLKMVAKNARRANARGSLRFASVGDKLLFSTSTESSGYASNGVVKVGTSIPTGWMDLQFNVEKWIPQAVEARVPRYVDKVAGSDAGFVAAAHFKFRAPGRPEEEFWLYEGSEHVLPFTKNVVSAVLHRRTLGLPFQIQLDKFTIHHDPGTEKAAGYESQVTVRGEPGNQSARISMNEPLQYGGYTFYQASYQLQEGEAPISVFSVNFDPGRMVKYAGSLFLCLGILLMFYMNPHYWNVLLGAQRLSQKPFVGRGEPK